MQTVTLVADDNTVNYWKLSLVHSGLTGETDPCLRFDATGDEVEDALEGLAAIGVGGVDVTRRGSGTRGDPYVHSIYFEGLTTAGDVNEVRCLHFLSTKDSTVENRGRPRQFFWGLHKIRCGISNG